MNDMDEDEVRKIVKEAARQTVNEVLSSLGLDARDIKDAQRDFIFLRSWRETTEVVKKRGFAATVTLLLSGIAALIVMALKGNGYLP